MDRDTNPKIAVALSYSQGQEAPTVVAKGQGWVAEQIIAKAEEEGIAINENPLVVKALSSLEIGEEIPPELYTAVAEILAFVYSLDKAKGKRF